MKKVVIAGSASLQEKILHWKKYWEDAWYEVLNYPHPIPKENFLSEYPQVHTEFFQDLTKADFLFVMNEEKNGVVGYLGAESFAEMCFWVAQNLLYQQNLKIILQNMPDKKVASYEEVTLWLKLGWIELFVDSQ